jgi:hypothetical protein
MRSEIVAVMLLAAACLPTTQPLPADQLAHFQDCNVDSDCVIATNGCCCDTVFINEKKTSDFRSQFACVTHCDCFQQDECPKCVQGLCTSAPLPPDGGICL